MRCLHGSRADLEMGMSSDRQVIHSTCRSGFGGFDGAAGFAGRGTPNIEPMILGG